MKTILNCKESRFIGPIRANKLQCAKSGQKPTGDLEVEKGPNAESLKVATEYFKNSCKNVTREEQKYSPLKTTTLTENADLNSKTAPLTVNELLTYTEFPTNTDLSYSDLASEEHLEIHKWTFTRNGSDLAGHL